MTNNLFQIKSCLKNKYIKITHCTIFYLSEYPNFTVRKIITKNIMKYSIIKMLAFDVNQFQYRCTDGAYY